MAPRGTGEPGLPVMAGPACDPSSPEAVAQSRALRARGPRREADSDAPAGTLFGAAGGLDPTSPAVPRIRDVGAFVPYIVPIPPAAPENGKDACSHSSLPPSI